MQLVLEVVPLDEDLEHRLVPRQAVIGPVEPLTEEADDLLRDRGELVDACGVRGADPGVASGPLGLLGEGGECGELVADTGEDALPFCVDQRLVEPTEADAAGQVADDGEAQLGGDDEPVERLAGSGVVWR